MDAINQLHTLTDRGFVARAHASRHRATIAFILCGALAREVVAIIARHHWVVDLYGIPALDHMLPERIAPHVAQRLDEIGERYERTLVIFGDCGTRGALDALLNERNLERLDSPHCYEMYGGDAFETAMAEEPGTFFLTDFLVRGFEGTVWRGMGLDKFPQLKDDYFRHYKRLLYFTQIEDDDLLAKAQQIADRLNLPLEVQHSGYNRLEAQLCAWMARSTTKVGDDAT